MDIENRLKDVQDRLAMILGQYIQRTVVQEIQIEELQKRVKELEDKYEPKTTSAHGFKTAE